ncbi:four-carbon acid sugar kinase family protein [Rhizobium sp. 1AS11]|uniref:3-oxo-tetronate kinase n=1 Tax=Rhizobium acaciae TaxID=2989736 RepID=UPI002222D379|nr:3-oxo-tetronate kinase [Rhizobium acaciae]MCW1411250.1 four-carbon acid sugar kinase family protein [Rhizobium acaciae]MCW1743338.1 four-carbon acid sugar kinase family protein [Rhizobium acaciae]
MKKTLGCIADDFTGATDLAGMLAKGGLRTAQMIGVPDTAPPDDVEAIVVALKSRTSPVSEAVGQSLDVLAYFKEQGFSQIYFKYCSTFDSTPEGNIGPVADALLSALKTDFTVVCPAFPANGRTIYKGNLFVGDVPLSESGMRNHPLTPMTDSNLVRVLQQQTGRKVGLVDYEVVARGASAVAARFKKLRREKCAYAVVDALFDEDLVQLGMACADLPLVTAASGLAIGIARNARRGNDGSQNDAKDGARAGDLPEVGGLQAVIAGSCSITTQGQVAMMRERHPAFQVVPADLAAGRGVVGQALEWAAARLAQEPVMIYATAASDAVTATQQDLGVEQAGRMVEDALSAIASGLVDLGVRQLIVAGGETSGAVVNALRIRGLLIGPEIDPGVPWTVTLPSNDHPPLALALKSGNFGTPDFFLKAWELIA